MGADIAATRLLVDQTAAGQRIDRYLAAALPELSRSYIQQLLGDGHIRVNDAIVKASYNAQAGDAVAVTLPLPRPVDIVPEDLPLVIRYEDADLLVVDKPAGMVVHPAPGHTSGTLVNALLFHFPAMRIGDDLRPGIVHRLDRETSGLLVVAKNDRAKAALQAQQQARKMRKLYLALIEGNFREPNGTIDAPIDRHPLDRMRMGVVAGGRASRTHYRTLEPLGPYSLVEAQLETGRTHQIRVHFQHKHHPIIGDQVYGPKRPGLSLGLKRQFLHARQLGFCNVADEWIECESPLPPELQVVLDELRVRYGVTQEPGFDPEQPWWRTSNEQ